MKNSSVKPWPMPLFILRSHPSMFFLYAMISGEIFACCRTADSPSIIGKQLFNGCWCLVGSETSARCACLLAQVAENSSCWPSIAVSLLPSRIFAGETPFVKNLRKRIPEATPLIKMRIRRTVCCPLRGKSGDPLSSTKVTRL